MLELAVPLQGPSDHDPPLSERVLQPSAGQSSPHIIRDTFCPEKHAAFRASATSQKCILCETSFKFKQFKMWNRSFRARLPSNSNSSRLWNRSFCARLPSNSNRSRYESEAFVQDFLQLPTGQTSNRSRCENEAFVRAWDVKTKPFALTSLCSDIPLLWHPFALTSLGFGLSWLLTSHWVLTSLCLWHLLPLTSIAFDIHCLWHPSPLTSHCLWHPLPLTSIAFGIHCLWHPLPLTSIAFDIHCLWHPLPLTSIAFDISSLWHLKLCETEVWQSNFLRQHHHQWLRANSGWVQLHELWPMFLASLARWGHERNRWDPCGRETCLPAPGNPGRQRMVHSSALHPVSRCTKVKGHCEPWTLARSCAPVQSGEGCLRRSSVRCSKSSPSIWRVSCFNQCWISCCGPIMSHLL